jgi:hypothetical protein
MSKYHKTIGRDAKGKSDVYDILEAFNVRCPAVQHAVKKLLMPGQRGEKSAIDDLREAKASIERAINMQEHRAIACRACNDQAYPEAPAN